jgi:hypothetical protein
VETPRAQPGMAVLRGAGAKRSSLVEEVLGDAVEAQENAGSGAGGLAGIPDQGAIDEYFFYAGGERGGIGVGGIVDDRVCIEEHQVGEHAFAKDAAIFPAEALRGKRSHFTDGFGKSEPVLFADEATEDARECAGGARMSGADATIAGDHHPGLLVEGLDVIFDHRLANDGGFGVCGITFANQAYEHFDRSEMVGGGEIGDGVSHIRFVGREADDGDMGSVANISESFLDAFWIFVLLVGNENF